MFGFGAGAGNTYNDNEPGGSVVPEIKEVLKKWRGYVKERPEPPTQKS